VGYIDAVPPGLAEQPLAYRVTDADADRHSELGEADGLVGAFPAEHLLAHPHPRGASTCGDPGHDQDEVAGDLADNGDVRRIGHALRTVAGGWAV
jgi:hypothetical protein